jgi:hypothetical protein
MNKKLIFGILLVPSLLLIFLAVLNYNNQRPDEHESQCLGSFRTFAYSAPDKNAPSLANTLPQDPWNVDTPLPIPSDNQTLISVETTRFINGSSEIWLKKDTSYRISQLTIHEYIIYRTDTRTWKTIAAQVDNTDIYVQKLFVAKDGSMWGQNAWPTYSNLSEVPILSTYDEREERFKFDSNVVTIPAAWRDSDGYDYWSNVLIDQGGIFWIFANKDAIFSYNPNSQEIKRRAEIPDLLVSHVALAPDHKIYLTRQWESPMFSIQDKEIWEFNPQSGDLKNLEAPLEPWPAYNNILVDHSGRLVLGAVGWRDENDTWHRMYPNSLVYFWNMKWEGDFRWYTPELILESSDGRLWFRKKLDDGVSWGMAWLNPETMSGCWFTTFDTNIVEDQQRNLWMAADGKLYKYSLRP